MDIEPEAWKLTGPKKGSSNAGMGPLAGLFPIERAKLSEDSAIG